MFNIVAGLIQKAGALGVGLLMLIENVFPVIPSELIMPMAGFEAARGVSSLFWVVAAGTAGSILGGIVWYRIGLALGAEGLARWADKGGRWSPIQPGEVRRGQAWFQKWGAAAVCVGRALPGVRGVICVPAGIARMPFGAFLLWSSVGALAWTAMLACAGYTLQAHYDQVARWLDPVTDGLVAVFVVAYLVRVARFKARA